MYLDMFQIQQNINFHNNCNMFDGIGKKTYSLLEEKQISHFKYKRPMVDTN